MASRWPFLVTLGLLLSVSCAFLLYHLHVQDLHNQRLRTNLVRKSTEAQKAVGDTSLKTLSFSGQSKHPRGVTTDLLAEWVAASKPVNLIDVREPEEVEMGQIPDTWERRYPDLQVDTDGLVVADKETVLLCESGNRSSELCDWFFERGITTRFMVGGYEKWVAEYRPMTGNRADGTDIRATPDYPQKETLLDTPLVMDLLATQGAVIVDVRYPEDFAREHLPGAINVPLRKMRAHEVDAALRALPARPIVAACYDKRSSFYGLLLGLRLHRLGADFRGRYTVPHEFVPPTTESAWVAQWRADREGDTLFGLVGQTVGRLVTWLADRSSLLLAIVVLVLLLRAMMLPFSLFAERDQWAQRQLAPRLAALRTEWTNDPAVWRREAMRQLRRQGVSPLRNLVGALVQIGLFAAAFSGIDTIAAARPTAVLWFDLSTADAIYVLPVLFGVCMFAFVRLQQQNKRRWVLPTLFVVIMVALVWQSRAAVLIYLMVSLGLMALQTVAQRRWLSRGAQLPQAVPQAVPTPMHLLTLVQAAAHLDLGNKAVRLGRMLAAGLPVPNGFVVPHGVRCDARALQAACARAAIVNAAVRSSAQGEDSATSSMAGMFRTELDVLPANLPHAIGLVRSSYGGRPGGVVVQAFRQAQYSGVLFTVDPAHAGRMLVELVAGGCDALVSGRATPKSFRFGRITGTLCGDEAPPLPLEQLIALARRVETLFGAAQDIEWVHADGHFQLVQARDITVLRGQQDVAGAIEAERARLLQQFANEPAECIVLEQTEITELLPAPTTYSLALFQSLWEAGGSVDRACRANAFPYDVAVDSAPLVQTAFGRCFVNVRQRRERSQKALSAVASFRMAASAQSLEDAWRTGQPARRQRVTHLAAIDPARLGDADLLQLCEDVRAHFVGSTYVETEMVNLAAGFFVDAARRRAERAGLDAAALLRDPDGNVTSRAFAQLTGPRNSAAKLAAFLADFGHRAPHDLELAEARYEEDTPKVLAMMARSSAAMTREVPSTPPTPPGRVLTTALARARRCQALKEEAKHEAMRELSLLRSLLLHVGARFGLGLAVFELLPDEVRRLHEPAMHREALAIATQREALRQALLPVQLPTQLSLACMESLGKSPSPIEALTGAMHGTCVAGNREVVGPVRVLTSPEQLSELVRGEILVARCTDPCWLSAFPVASGLITEIGGWLSHAAIQAREHNLATVVGVVDATRRLTTGDVVCLRRNGVVELVPERRRPRQPVDLTGELRLGDWQHPVRIRNVSAQGAQIEIDNPSALPTAAFELHVGAEVRRASVAWRNCTRAGVKFATASPLALVSSPEIDRPAREVLSARSAIGR